MLCFVFIAPPAFLMGFPMPTAMTTLGRLGKDHMFIWAWGVNGCFSVIGAAAAPVIATNFGLGAVIEIAGCAYLLALPAFFGVIAVDKSVADPPAQPPDRPKRSCRRRRTAILRFCNARTTVATSLAIIKFSKFSRVLLIKMERRRAEPRRFRSAAATRGGAVAGAAGAGSRARK